MTDRDNLSTQSETAELKENGDISIAVFAESASGRRMHGGSTVRPDEAHYLACKARFGLNKPGDSATIDSEWRDGKWVAVGS